MAAANGVRRIWIGQNGLLSTPAVSAVIRERVGADVSFFAKFHRKSIIFLSLPNNTCIGKFRIITIYKHKSK